MKIKKGPDFKLIPRGWCQSVCCEFKDLGMVEREFNGKKEEKHQGVFMFQTEHLHEDGDYAGQRMEIRFYCTLTWSERGKMRPFLESWRDAPFSDEEMLAFDTDKVIGLPARLKIDVYQTKSGFDRNKIVMIEPTESETPLEPLDYVPLDQRDTKESDESGDFKPSESRERKRSNKPSF